MRKTFFSDLGEYSARSGKTLPYNRPHQVTGHCLASRPTDIDPGGQWLHGLTHRYRAYRHFSVTESWPISDQTVAGRF